MKRKACFVWMLLLVLAVAPAAWGMEVITDPQGVDPFAAPEVEKEAVEAAAKVALSWLEGVDSGAYEASWEQASHLFQLAVRQEDWQRQLLASRAPMGELIARKRSNAQYTETLPGAPDGVYVVLQYATSFTKKSRGVETVTMQLEDDGSWRVGGYFIR